MNILRRYPFFLVFALLLSGCGDTEPNLTGLQPKPTGKLNDTGITLCADYAFASRQKLHDVALHCSLLVDEDGDPIPLGQDATFGRDITDYDDSDGHAGFSFTKIDQQGQALPADAAEWACVKDNVTGLIWEVKQGAANDVVGDSGLHDPDDSYSWYDSDVRSNGGDERTTNIWQEGICHGYVNGNARADCNTEAFQQRVNAERWCGLDTWRLPDVNELSSIVDFSRSVTVDTHYFPQMQPREYWTSMPNVGNPIVIQLIGFQYGSKGASDWNSRRHARLVSSGSFTKPTVESRQATCTNPNVLSTTPTQDFTVNADGTVIHNTTGLMWKRCLEGQTWSDNGTPDNALDDSCSGKVSTFNWQDALLSVQAGNDDGGFAGYVDWRMPDRNELQSIIESCRRDATNPAIFLSRSVSSVPFFNAVWSSSPVFTPFIDDASLTWYGVFDHGGGVSQGFRNYSLGLRLVRYQQD